MTQTPSKSWRGSDNFGLRGYFEESRARPFVPEPVLEQINLALEDLGIESYRVIHLKKEPSELGHDAYAVTLSRIGRTQPPDELRLEI